MKRIYSKELTKYYDKKIKIAGYLFQRRFLGGVVFIILRDKDGIIQIVVKDKNELSKLEGIADESILEIEGDCIKDERAPGKAEIHNPKIKILQAVKEEYRVPIEINKPQIHAHIDTLLDHRPIVLRNPLERAIFRIQSTMAQSFREYCIDNGFTEIFTPTIVETATEGGSELFEIKYYDRTAYLAQSAQLYKQIMVGVFEKVFATAHSYRAEKFGTSRHLTEFIQYEFEMGFIESYKDIYNSGIEIIKYIKDKIEKVNLSDLEILQKKLPVLPKDIPIIKFSEAKKITQEESNDEFDLSPKEEKLLSKKIFDEYKSDLMVVTHYPTKKRPFYTMVDKDNPKETLSFDFILRGEEILTGGERITDYDELQKAIEKKGMNPKNLQDYLEIFKYGIPKEGGFGMGLERLTQQFLGFTNIRETTLFPRDVKRLAP